VKRFLLLLVTGTSIAFFSAALTSATSPVAAQQQAAPAATPTLPDGPGKDLVLRYCSNCHTIVNITSARKDEDGWTATLTKMVGYGMQGNEDDLETILAYLTKNYGPQSPARTTAATVLVNKESAADLAAHLGLSQKDANAIVAYREKNGPYKTIDDLKKVPDIDAMKIDEKKDLLSFAS
jgi:competence protein ComEA